LTRNRYDETWHRLIEWTKGQAPSERLAAQILIHEGFSSLDPSHPLGGPDGGKDAMASKDGVRFAMAVYFPRGRQRFSDIASKFEADLAGARQAHADGIAFVTNQELTLGEREKLRATAGPTLVDLFHLERITTILDTPTMARVREQFLDINPEGAHARNLGGFGGAAPCAGGGGGGAIGNNARGGDGGPGGEMIILDGGPGQAPGAGGGGAGVIGEDAIGGEGGGGGEHVKITLGPEDLAGIHHFQFHVGEGGKGGPGEDTIVNLCKEDGTVVRQIKAKGGKAGAPAYCPPPRRVPTRADLDAGLKVTAMLAAEYIRARDGLWTIVEGGWDWVQVGTVPFRQLLPLYIEIDTGTISPPGSNLELYLVILRPDGFLLSQQSQIITVESGPIKRSRFAVALEIVGSQGGVWHVQVRAGSEVIADFPIEIHLPVSARN
jgi:hypothetical protein